MNLASFKMCLVRSDSNDRPVTHALRECDNSPSWEDCCCRDLLSAPNLCPGESRLYGPLVTRPRASDMPSHRSFHNNENDPWVKVAINSPHQIRSLHRDKVT